MRRGTKVKKGNTVRIQIGIFLPPKKGYLSRSFVPHNGKRSWNPSRKRMRVHF
jgi:hypothetical protein